MVICILIMSHGNKHTEVLVHSIRVVSPGLELISESREFLLESLDVRRVLVEEDL